MAKNSFFVIQLTVSPTLKQFWLEIRDCEFDVEFLNLFSELKSIAKKWKNMDSRKRRNSISITFYVL